MIEESSGDSTSFKMSDTQMVVILSRKFAPFDFFVVPGFPNVVPTIDEWGDCLPIFKESKYDHPTENFLKFHELMHQWDIVKMFS
jgi:hypothetical protein